MTYSERLQNALQNEHNKIFSEETGSLKAEYSEKVETCQVCDLDETSVYCIKDGFVHLKCKNCGFIYISPRMNVEATHNFYNSEVNEIYNETKFHGDSESVSLDDLLNIKNYEIVRHHYPLPQGKKLLEIGPGRGVFLKNAKKEGFEVHAIELNSKLITQLESFCEKVYSEDILNLDLDEDYFDVIYFRDVMEHIPDVVPFLMKVKSVLKPGGLLLIDTHNIDSLINRLTKEYHTVIFGFEHPVHWSAKTLKLVCEKNGFTHLNTFYSDIDLSLHNFINYRTNLSFTYIFPPKKSKLTNFVSKVVLFILSLPLVRHLDRWLSNLVSSTFNCGAKMQVTFTK